MNDKKTPADSRREALAFIALVAGRDDDGGSGLVDFWDLLDDLDHMVLATMLAKWHVDVLADLVQAAEPNLTKAEARQEVLEDARRAAVAIEAGRE